MDTIERLRTRCWYEYVRGKFGGPPESDYQLSMKFDPDCVTGASRVPLFESIRKTLPKLKPSLLDQVNEVYPGTRDIYLSPFWHVLGQRHLDADELQQLIVQAVEVTQFYNLNVYIDAPQMVKPQPQHEEYWGNLEVKEALRAMNTRYLNAYRKIKMQMRAEDTRGNLDFLVFYLGDVALIAGFYRYYLLMSDLERAIVAKDILLDDVYLDLVNIPSPLKGSTIWPEIVNLCRHQLFDIRPDQLPRHSFESLLKGKLEPESLPARMIAELDSYQADRLPSIDNTPKQAVTTFHIPKYLKSGLEQLKLKAQISGSPRSINVIMVDALYAYMALPQNKREPVKDPADKAPLIIRLPPDLKTKLEAESEYWSRELGAHMPMGQIISTAIAHYLRNH